ncbi:MAG: class I SAM-dependent methyltransferase [Bryobacterales bacterium]|nr:class I SAM-dependent methyltransferase [Bryobacterales bacterium]
MLLRAWLSAILVVGAVFGQQEVYEQYRRWITTQPVAVQKEAEPLARYREHLRGKGLDEQTVEAQIELIRKQGSRMEVERWNRILTAPKPAFNVEPNAFLVEMVKGRKPGKALDVGMGQGRNAIWLAQQGWESVGFDPAERAVAAAVATAQKLGVKLQTEIATAESFDFGENRWDLVVLSYVGAREFHEKVVRSLKPGGIVVLEAMHRDATKGRSIGGAVVFDSGELPGLFRELRMVRYQEPLSVADFGRERVRLVQMCGEKPGE